MLVYISRSERLPTTTKILCGFQGLVNVLGSLPLARNTGQAHPMVVGRNEGLNGCAGIRRGLRRDFNLSNAVRMRKPVSEPSAWVACGTPGADHGRPAQQLWRCRPTDAKRDSQTQCPERHQRARDRPIPGSSRRSPAGNTCHGPLPSTVRDHIPVVSRHPFFSPTPSS